MINQNEMLEKAKEHERKAKELRTEVRKANEEIQRKLSESIGKIISEIIGRPFEEADVNNFRQYAKGIGAEHILDAMNSTTTNTSAHSPDEQ